MRLAEGVVGTHPGSACPYPIWQEDPGLLMPRSARSGTQSVESRFIPYRYGMSSPNLRPIITD